MAVVRARNILIPFSSITFTVRWLSSLDIQLTKQKSSATKRQNKEFTRTKISSERRGALRRKTQATQYRKPSSNNQNDKFHFKLILYTHRTEVFLLLDIAVLPECSLDFKNLSVRAPVYILVCDLVSPIFTLPDHVSQKQTRMCLIIS